MWWELPSAKRRIAGQRMTCAAAGAKTAWNKASSLARNGSRSPGQLTVSLPYPIGRGRREHEFSNAGVPLSHTARAARSWVAHAGGIEDLRSGMRSYAPMPAPPACPLPPLLLRTPPHPR
jgi:hypothetical protein